MEPSIGERLTRWLQFRGVRPAALARALEVSRTTVHKWTTNAVAPDTDRLVAVAAALEITMLDFFGPLPDLHSTPPDAEPVVDELGPHPSTGDITRDFGTDGIERMLRGPCPTCGHNDEAA